MTLVHPVILAVPLEVLVISKIYDFDLYSGVKSNNNIVDLFNKFGGVRVAFLEGYSSSLGYDKKIFDDFCSCLPNGFKFIIKKVGEYHEVNNSPVLLRDYIQTHKSYRRPSTYFDEDFALYYRGKNEELLTRKYVLMDAKDLIALKKSIWAALQVDCVKFVPAP